MSDTAKRTHFLTDIIDADLAAGRNGGHVVTRFPPEPNGFLHLGHSKSILLNYGLAQQYGGRFHLRFDDTNPTTEDTAYVESIQHDVRWLGAQWGAHLHFASDYFERMYDCAVRLIRDGKAYVDSQSAEAIREQRGSFSEPGTDGPFRGRSVDENLALFAQMRAGAFRDGECVLRARIDMAHPNVLLRDPLLYRIRHAHHHRTGDTWCVYPMYDYAHPLEDAFEGVTHSLCTLEFESNRELYDWVLDNLGPWDPRPRQYEFARLSLGYTMLSKRTLLQLVNDKTVAGWDDPRMPTLAGLRRRGVTPEALRDFAELIGVAKNNSTVDIGKFEFCVRGDLERRSPRAMAVLEPLRVELTNWPAGAVETLNVPWWPGEPERGGGREVPLSGALFIEREDFAEDPPKDWKRLAPGREVRLANAYVVRCDEVLRGADGAITALRCTYDPASRGAEGEGARKGLGTLHWVDAQRSVPLKVQLFDRLFTIEQPALEQLNPESLVVPEGARVEPALAKAEAGQHYQFLRKGYFFVDPASTPGALVFNRVVTLKDTWANRAAPQPAAPRRNERKAPEPNATPSTKKSRTEHRAEHRANNPAAAQRFERYQSELGLGADEADLLTRDESLSAYFEQSVEAGASARSSAKWLRNELLGLAPDGAVEALGLGGADFGRFVALVDSGAVTQAAGKTLLASLVEKPGDPAARVNELGLARVDDGAAVDAAIERGLASQRAELERYRAGEKKLFGVLLGAVMREARGADAQSVRKALAAKLG